MVPTVICVILGFVIGSFFMSVYGISADTILVIFCIDEEIHKNHLGTNNINAPPALQEFIKQAEG